MLLTDLIRIIDGIFHYKLFEVKRTPVTLSSMMVFILILLVFAVLSRAFQRTVFRRILNRTHIDHGIQFTLLRLSHYIIMVIGAIAGFSIRRHRPERFGGDFWPPFRGHRFRAAECGEQFHRGLHSALRTAHKHRGTGSRSVVRLVTCKP